MKTKLFASRLHDEQARADRMRERLERELRLGEVGLWLVLWAGAWSQA